MMYNIVYCKVMRMLGFVYRNAREFNEPASLKVLCYALLRPILDYG